VSGHGQQGRRHVATDIPFPTFLLGPKPDIFILELHRAFRESSIIVYQDKRIFMTGGSSGIGLATTVQLARAGAHIAIAARDESRLATALAAVRAASTSPNARLEAVSMDVASAPSVQADVARSRRAWRHRHRREQRRLRNPRLHRSTQRSLGVSTDKQDVKRLRLGFIGANDNAVSA
jgi:hypothetical protein